jgi:D-alanyl-D-alanine carboxypeptidase/D-alanyl-D-alanine-endopeptidase (penicillin-binding protein 4)
VPVVLGTLFVGGLSPAYAQAEPGSATGIGAEERLVDPEIQQLRRELPGILRSTGNTRGRWGVLAISLDHGDTLLALNPDQPMVPASNMKLLSTAAALHYLGPTFRYRTFLLAEGRVREGVLEGNLILYGTGDPTLSERFYPDETAALDSLASRLTRAGVREIRGNLVVDGSFFSGPELHPDWDPEDLNDTFAAPVSALELAENSVTIRVEPGSWVGAQPSIITAPEAAGIPLNNLGRTVPAGARSRVWLLREHPRDPIGIEGEIPLGGAAVWRRLPVGDPLAFAGGQMVRALARQGILVRGDMVPVRDEGASSLSGLGNLSGTEGHPAPRILATLESPPLLEILRVINKQSHNLLAETVLKTIGRAVSGEGSFSAGAAAVERYLAEVVGVPPGEVAVRDGSGLSVRNQASPQVFVRTLEYLSGSDEWDMFLETLPIAGDRRELRRMYNTPAARNLRAKTGTMEDTSALSGLVLTRAGERVLFSILSNEVPSEYRAKRAEDRIGVRLASLTRPLGG